MDPRGLQWRLQDPGAPFENPGAPFEDPGAPFEDPGAPFEDPGAPLRNSSVAKAVKHNFRRGI